MDLIDSQENRLSWKVFLEVQSLHSEQGQLEQAAQGCAKLGFEHLQRQRVLNLPGQPVPVFNNCIVKMFFSHV